MPNTIVKLVGSRGTAYSVVPQSLLNVYPVPAYGSASCTALHGLKVLLSGLSEDFQPVTLGLVKIIGGYNCIYVVVIEECTSRTVSNLSPFL